MMMPSIKRIMQCFRDITLQDAALIRRIGHAVDNGEELQAIIEANCPKTAAYVRSLYSSPYNSHMWRVTVALHAMDVICITYGVERLGPTDNGDPQGRPPYEYLNNGDTYAATLVYCRESDSMTIASWGDIAERHSNW